jgi:hypothetical protein
MSACLACGYAGPAVAVPSRDTWLASACERLQHAVERARLAAVGVRDAWRPGRNGPPPGLAAVTCLFNPCGYRALPSNLHRFRESFAASGVPLLIVELAIGDQVHCAGPGYGEVLKLRARDIMWHKERLLNVGIAALIARGARKIAWLDADVVFDHPAQWAWRMWEELERSAMCQAFSLAEGSHHAARISAVLHHRRTGLAKPDAVAPSLRHPWGVLRGHTGFAWAATAEVLQGVMLYDRAVLGGGDGIMRFACLPRDEGWERELRRKFTSVRACARCGHRAESVLYTSDGLDWARRWSDAVGGRVGYVHGRIRDLEHGAHRDRGWSTRREILFRHGFDPARDIEMDDQGCWRWASAKPALHREVERYFADRREDG